MTLHIMIAFGGNLVYTLCTRDIYIKFLDTTDDGRAVLRAKVQLTSEPNEAVTVGN
jgi:hypothetical protein